MKTGNPQAKVNVIVLYTVGCPHTNPAIEMLNQVADDINIPIELKTVQITTQTQAVEYRFLGSPTIQVNGLDIEPAARNAQLFGIT